MREPLSLLFIDQQLQTLEIVPEAWPNRIYRCAAAWSVLETARKPRSELEKIQQEVLLLSVSINLKEYADIGRIETCVQNAA